MARIFLESTIQIRRMLFADPIRQAIQQQLQAEQVVTSTYVWMEIQRTIGQDFQYLIDLLLTKQPTTMALLITHLGEGEGLFSARSLRRILLIAAQLLDELGQTNFDPIEAAYLLRRQRDWMINQQFFEDVDETIDVTQCDLVKPDYKVEAGGRISCNRETAQCSLPALLQANMESIQNLGQDSAATSALGKQTERALTEIAKDSTLAKGERNCWAIADLILVLECPSDAAIWTTNLRHFEPLCQRFGRQLFEPETPA